MPQPVALRLSRNSQPYWLTHLAQPQTSPLRPLLLLPGGGGQGVEVEDSLIFAASSLLQSATSSHGSCGSTAIVLPFVTSSTLRNFVALLRQGRVTIAKEELPDLEAIFSVLKIKIATSIGEVCKTSIFTKGECELLKTKDVKQVENVKSNQKGNQPGCATPSATHAPGCATPSVAQTRKTPSLLHTMLSSPAKRPAIIPLKENPTDESKRRRTCPTPQLSPAPTKTPLPYDAPTKLSSTPHFEQTSVGVPEGPKSSTGAIKQQILSPKELKEKDNDEAVLGQVAPKLAGSEAGLVSSAPRQMEQTSAEGSVSIVAFHLTNIQSNIVTLVFRAAAKLLSNQASIFSRAAL